MCKFISSDSIIGNFVIETLEKDMFMIELEKLYDFDDLLSDKLAEYDYYTKFDLRRVVDFQENYPFLVRDYDDKFLHIENDIVNKEELQAMLIRYFRLGMPKVVINEMKIISKTILG